MQRGDCYQKDQVWCIVCEVGETHTTWRTAHSKELSVTPTLALEFHLEVEGWQKLPLKVSPGFEMSAMLITNSW